MILQKLKQIKAYCGKHDRCNNCVYVRRKIYDGYLVGQECVIYEAVSQLTLRPRSWDIEKVKEILNGIG